MHRGKDGKNALTTRALRCLAVVALCLSARAAAADAPGRANKTEAPAMLFGGRISLGLFFGGDGVARPSGLPAGEGGLVALGVSSTPWWVANQRVGLGLGVDAGFKYASSVNGAGGVSMRRFPLLASVHGLFRLSDSVMLPVAVGPQVDLGVRWRAGRGEAEEKIAFSNAVGFMVETGMIYIDLPIALNATVRYTAITYAGPTKVAANSLGVVMTLGYYIR